MKRAVLAALLFLSAAGLARADALADAVKALPSTVAEGATTVGEVSADVTMIGPGRQAGKTGSYRVIVVRDQATPPMARLFVQWISGNRVETSLEIKEFAALGIDVEDLRGKIEGGDLAMFIAASKTGEDPENYELFVTGPAKYRFGKASN